MELLTKLITKDTLRKYIRAQFDYSFAARKEGLYIIEISARAQGEKQIGKDATDDDDLRIELEAQLPMLRRQGIDGRKFPKLNNPHRYLDAPAAFSGGQLHNLKKTVFFFIQLSKGKHAISFIPDGVPLLEEVSVSYCEHSEQKGSRSGSYGGDKILSIDLDIKQQAEDGDRRPWITFVFVDLPLVSFTAEVITQYRLRDSDDVKVLVDGTIQEQPQSPLHRFWIFAGSITKKFFGKRETQRKTFHVALPRGLHYIEFWADKTPTLHKLTFEMGKLDVTIKARVVWQETVIREGPFQNENIILEGIKRNEITIVLEKAVKGERPLNEQGDALLSDRWHKVEYKGNAGFIYSEALEIEGEDQETIQALITQKSRELNEDGCLMLAIAKRESKFFPYAFSQADARGLFQLKRIAVLHVNKRFKRNFSGDFDLDQHIEAGILYFQIVKEKYQGKDHFWERCLSAWNRGMDKVAMDQPFTMDDQPVETRQFIEDVFLHWKGCKGSLKGKGAIWLILLIIGIFSFAIYIHPFFKNLPFGQNLSGVASKRAFPLPPKYQDFSILGEEYVDIKKDGNKEKLLVVSNIPTEFTAGITKILFVKADGSFFELPDNNGELQWWKVRDFNKNGALDVAVLYGYSGSAGFGKFYLYEWTGSRFVTLLSREDIGSEVDFQDINGDGKEEVLYTFLLSKWGGRKQKDTYTWDVKTPYAMLK
ncbi:MAG: transglycosylase SLT domain-containing protein [Candidatus Colwellbacteria bacterium]|nr:transglycosylase SLT domain-containing protein [Candidatus Colwellbacteria bacterium]